MSPDQEDTTPVVPSALLKPYASVVVLIAFGVVLLIPALAARVQAPLSRLARFGPRTRGSGFWSFTSLRQRAFRSSACLVAFFIQAIVSCPWSVVR